MLSSDKVPWLELALTPGLGAARARRLLERFGSPQAIFGASRRDLARVEGMDNALLDSITGRRGRNGLDNQLLLLDRYKADFIPLEDARYPDSLRSIYGPPVGLFVKGEIKRDDYFSLAVVGTRMSSFYGRQMSAKISGQLAEKGMVIVSGGARGIDTAAHWACLRAGGRTIAVLGCGLDTVYPAENKELFARIAERGALVSEFALGTSPDRKYFPMRNRIISGLSLGVLVVEAPLRSGALITVRHAVDQGREVFSVPGEAGKFNSLGTNQLLREGARLVEGADDIWQELERYVRQRVKEMRSACPQRNEGVRKSPSAGAVKAAAENDGDLGAGERSIYALLSDDPRHIDFISDKSGLPLGKVSSALLCLEMKGLIKQLPGKMFRLNAG
ncbi:MAG: DNA-processing protein DprA [Candidatus Omnitrophota bacterium]